MTDVWKWNTEATRGAVAAGTISTREVVQAHLDRLDQVNPAINAVTQDVRGDALEAAAGLDAAFASGGVVGPLHGVPITIKENIDVAGQTTPNGIAAFADVVAPSDSPLVGHLRAAGAVIVGRTNTPEMSYRWHTTNPLRGETKNPWSTGRTAGGSSGGAAASVAIGIGAFAHGNDLGGSVRQPANCCGLVGLRPSLGRVASHNASAPAERSLALQLMSVQGPLAREVADVRTAFEMMAQRSARDPWHIAAPLDQGRLDEPIHVAATYGEPNTPTQAPVRAAIDTAAAHLSDAGYVVEFVDPPHLEEIRDAWQAILATETSVTAMEAIESITSPEFQRILGWMFTDESLLDLAGYVAAYSRRAAILRDWTEFLEARPLVLAPASQEIPFAPNDDASSSERFFEILHGHAPLVAVNYLGLPACAVPSILDDSGPVGVQLVSRPFREDVCLDAAAAIESRVGIMTDNLWAR